MSDGSPHSNPATKRAILRLFRDAADEDYLVARYSAKCGLAWQFCWSAQQAIEKYIKSVLLLNGISIQPRHHLVGPFNKAVEVGGGLLPPLYCPPQSIGPYHSLHGFSDSFEKYTEFVERVETQGNSNNRYRSYSIQFAMGDLHKLDELCFRLRRVAYPLDEFLSKQSQTAREFLEQNPNEQIHSTLSFQRESNGASLSLANAVFEWRNFSYASEKASREAASEIKFLARSSGLSQLFTSIPLTAEVICQNEAALHWIADNAMSKSEAKSLRKEFEEYKQSRAIAEPRGGDPDL